MAWWIVSFIWRGKRSKAGPGPVGITDIPHAGEAVAANGPNRHMDISSLADRKGGVGDDHRGCTMHHGINKHLQ